MTYAELEALEAEALNAREAAIAATKLRVAAEKAEKLADARSREAEAAIGKWLRDRRDAQREQRGLS